MTLSTLDYRPAPEAYVPLMRYAHTRSTNALQSDEGLCIAEMLDRVQWRWFDISQVCVTIAEPDLADYQAVPPQSTFPMQVHLRMLGPAKPRQHELPDDVE
ncbi:MAG: hypothetical protein AB7R89_05920 [Dehalococcoidia bacterium]